MGTQPPQIPQHPEQVETVTTDPSLRISMNLPITTSPSQMEVDDHQPENHLDITLHQPYYQIPNLNIPLSQDNPTQQLTPSQTQTNQSPPNSPLPADYQALDLEQLLNSLYDDLYTDPLLGY